jgi:quinoprotein glucose dehydrogenase
MKAGWAANILALILALIGLVLAIGGASLTILGGSIYYLIAGIALLASAWFLFRGRLLGGWIYVGTFVLSAIWGFAESRGNAWAMVPWLIAPLVLLVAVILVMPTLTRAGNRWKLAGGGIALAVVLVAASFAVLGTTGGQAALALPAQSTPGMTDPSVNAAGADWPA